MSAVVEEVVQELRSRSARLLAQHLEFFLGTYARTTEAVGRAVDAGSFEDPDWVERWDVVFARQYLTALDAFLDGDSTAVPRPWRLAFTAPASLPPLGHVLLGVNAHVNFDLPQALLAMIPPVDFDDPVLLGRRQRDHERIDAVLAGRVGAEDALLDEHRALRDRMLEPANHAASKRFLREARQKVWQNVFALHAARQAGDDALRTRVAELEVLSAARINDLLRPGQVVLRLAVAGFGIVLPPP